MAVMQSPMHCNVFRGKSLKSQSRAIMHHEAIHVWRFVSSSLYVWRPPHYTKRTIWSWLGSEDPTKDEKKTTTPPTAVGPQSTLGPNKKSFRPVRFLYSTLFIGDIQCRVQFADYWTIIDYFTFTFQFFSGYFAKRGSQNFAFRACHGQCIFSLSLFILICLNILPWEFPTSTRGAQICNTGLSRAMFDYRTSIWSRSPNN